jgi:phage repressor protein C with HTH and peptisase S24 domain
MKYAEGLSLISFNPAYEPLSFSNQEIEEEEVEIVGKVVENRQKYI